jgi:hypothetical protein
VLIYLIAARKSEVDFEHAAAAVRTV